MMLPNGAAHPPIDQEEICHQLACTKAAKSINHPEQAFAHLSEHIVFFNDLFRQYPRFEVVDSQGTLAIRKWSQFTELCHSLGVSRLGNLKDSTINDLFMGDGLCIAGGIEYFSQFFQSRSPLTSSPVPLNQEPLVSKDGDVRFYPLNLRDENLAENTRHLRFIQAAYLTASYFVDKHSTEYLAHQLQHKKKIALTKRLPEKSDKSFQMKDLLPELKNLTGKPDKGYLIAISAPSKTTHMLALHLDKPYHFFDLNYGIAMAGDDEGKFMLFLANYLTEKYPEYDKFALLEFSSDQSMRQTKVT